MRLVAPAALPETLDPETREWHRKMIRCIHCRRAGATQVILEQVCAGLSGIDQLDDAQLVALHQAMRKADECIRDGIPFEDVGLIKPAFELRELGL